MKKMNDLVYLLVGPAIVGLFALMYHMVPREWKSLTEEEIHALWDANMRTFGTVTDFAKALDRKLEERNR
jgi:hypothetical protein